VNRADRGPLLLIVAGVLLFLAVVAYVINDAEDKSRRTEAALRDRQVIQAQAQRSIVELKALRDESVRTIRDGAELHDQHEAILRSLGRIEKLLEGRAPTEPVGGFTQ
jgi:type II secretory pathway component PulM